MHTTSLSLILVLLSILELVMGFPVSYSELPSILLHAFLHLGFIRELISWAFDSIGLGDLLDSDAPSPDPNVQIYTHHHHHHHHHRSTLAVQVEEAMPAVHFAALGRETEGCAVCLHEFEGAAEVRRPSNCCHVFHRGCLDPWIEQGQRTCPLCRAAMFPAELKLALNDAAGGVISDTFFADYPSSPSLPAPILPHHFFSF